jgi:hypothetical protein
MRLVVSRPGELGALAAKRHVVGALSDDSGMACCHADLRNVHHGKVEISKNGVL